MSINFNPFLSKLSALAMAHRIFYILLFFMTCFAGYQAVAQITPRSFSVTAYALDATTLASGNMTISLFGIAPPAMMGDPKNTLARSELDDFIGASPVTCIPIRKEEDNITVAQCRNVQEQDIALYLINKGVVPTKRSDLVGHPLSQAYLDAERRARQSRFGIWGDMPAPPTEGEEKRSSPFSTQHLPLWVIAVIGIVVPFIGFFTLGFILHKNFKQLIHLQKYQLAGVQKREKLLKAREKYVIASALEGEINANRAKLDAFLVIYEEMLKSLKDPSKKPKYQRAGDIIHEKPALARTVYDAHVDKLDILGEQVKKDLAVLYENIAAAPDYRTLEPELPIEKVREIVDRILRAAMKLSDPMDKALAALGVIVRDKQGAISME
jgi:endonuclease YncB( thermonuclease family)